MTSPNVPPPALSMSNSTSTPTPTPTATNAERTLDAALHQALRAPPLPAHFRSQLMAAVQAQGLHDLEARRKVLEEEHQRARVKLRSGQVQMQRDTLAAVVVTAFAAGTCASLIVPWLSATTGVDSAISVPLLALVIGLVTSFRVWQERLGPSR